MPYHSLHNTETSNTTFSSTILTICQECAPIFQWQTLTMRTSPAAGFLKNQCARRDREHYFLLAGRGLAFWKLVQRELQCQFSATYKPDFGFAYFTTDFL